MISKVCLALALLVLGSAWAQLHSKRVVCYYDSKSASREGQGKMRIADLDPALGFCTHLIYGYAAISADSHKLIPLNERLDVSQNNYREVTMLKKRFPSLRVLLSVGGTGDASDTEKYLKTLETSEHRLAFINSAHTLLKAYEFDGIDLAWNFPTVKPKKIRGKISSAWHGFKKFIGVDSSKTDEKEEEHREQFTALVRELKNVIRHDGYILTITVMPNVNASAYMTTRELMPNVDQVHLLSFNYQTPTRNPKQADYTAPTYELNDRLPQSNVEHDIHYWMTTGAPTNKLVLGIPTYGLTWKLTEDSGITGVPPLDADGPGEAGQYTKEEGLLAYFEICNKLPNTQNAKGIYKSLRKVGDPSKKKGIYAYKPAEGGADGLWVGYEDPESATNKAGYVSAKGLGGVAIMDLSLDDFRGLCTGDKYPILRAAKTGL